MYIRNAILWFLSGLVDSLSFLFTNFQFVTNISEDMIEMRKNQIKTYMLQNHFLKVVMHIRNAILWFWVVLVDSLSFLFNFQFVTNIQEIWSKWGKQKNTYMLWNHFLKVGIPYPQCNSMILSGLVDSLSFLLLIFNLRD